MAKERRSAADLDAELAALEAELAALEGKPKSKAKAAAKAEAKAKAEVPEVKPTRVPETQSEAPSVPAPEKKSRFALPKFGKSKTEPAPESAPVPAPSPVAPAIASEPAPAPRPIASPASSFDLSLWRQDGDAWVRTVPETPVPVVRRVLDEEGNVVREEKAEPREVEQATGVKAERGLGRLLRRK